ncbi:MAG: cell division protein FtsA [Dehalococcoidia bacterium]|nr:cell division protein FtsA [Dehalococcoidia bacterium]
MSRKSIVTAIDVGTTKIATIIAEQENNGGVRVVGVGITPSYGMHKGLVVNINDAKGAIRDSIRKAEQSCNVKVESAYVGVTGRHVTSTNNKGVVAITNNDRLVRTDDLRRVMNTAQSIKVPQDRKLLHVIPRTYAVDGQVGVKNPVGMHGFRLDVETHIITAAANSVQNLVKCIRGIGVDIDDMVLEPLASSEAVLTEDERHAGVAIADIGGGTTDICVFKDGSIYHTAILPVAGYQLTRDVAIGLGLPFEVAEEMKRRYGSVMSVYDNKMAAAPPVSEDGHGISYQDLCDILHARVEEILRLVLLELPSSDYESVIPAGLVLTGGSSNISGIETMGCEILKLPVRVGCPLHITGITDSLRDPAYATGVGLLLWGSKHPGRASEYNGGFWTRRLRSMANRLAVMFTGK